MQRSFMPSMEALITLETAARLGSFSAAATELCLTQGAVSRQIQKLEERLGVQLFLRTRQRVSLTEAGAAYLVDIRDILANLSDATTRVRRFADAKRRIDVAVQPTVATCWLIPKLPQFLQDNPHVDLNLAVRTESSENWSGQFDVAIQRGRMEMPGYVRELLFDNDLSAVCSPQFKHINGVRSPFDFLDVRRLHHTTRPECWSQWLEGIGISDAGQRRQGIWLERIPMIIQAALSGVGIALLPRVFIEEHLASGALVIMHDQAIAVGDGYYLIQARNAVEKTRSFVDWLRAERDKAVPRRGAGSA